MFSSLKIREFRIFWFAMLFSLIGTWVQSMAQSWLVFKLTHSAFLMGVVGFLSYLPISLFSLAAGVFVDRMIKRNILIGTQFAFMILAVILAGLVQSHRIHVWQIIILAFSNGMVLSLDAPTRQAMVVDLVGRQHLLNAIALNSAAFNSARILGPALAGILIAFIGLGGCFYVNALSFLPVIFALLLIKPKPIHSNIKHNTFFQDVRETAALIKNNHFILGVLGLVGMVSIFGVSYSILMPIFAEGILHSGSTGLAVLMSANGVGALAGALYLARLKAIDSKLELLSVFVSILFVSIILFSFSKSLLFSSIMLLLAGFGGVSCMSMANTLLQMSIPDEHRGRLMGVFMMMFGGLMPFGNLLAGALAHILGAQMVVFFGALLSLGLYLSIEKNIYPARERVL